MNMLNKIAIVAGRLFPVSVLILSLAFTAGAEEEQTLHIFTSILPQVEFVERIGGAHVTAEALVQPGQSPATYEPTPRQMARLSEADAFFRIGVPFENVFIPKLKDTAKNLPIVDTRKHIALRTMGSHDHDHHADQHGGGKDPHIWLDPQLVVMQAINMYTALTDLDPAHEATYRRNLAAFIDDLLATDARLRQVLAPVRGRTLMVFHPAFGYFADAYGLDQEPIEIEGKAPSARQLARIIDHAREENVQVIFVQPQFDEASAKAIAKAIKGAVVAINPLAKDYRSNLDQMAKTIAEGLKEQNQP
jgi:zinc transport system substrate-binding protein